MHVLHDKMTLEPATGREIHFEENARQLKESVKMQKRILEGPLELHEPATTPDPRLAKLWEISI